MRYSTDLRKRVVAFVRGGGSKAEAARVFQVSRSNIYNWLAMDDVTAYEKPGPQGARKLDRQELAQDVKARGDMTLKERALHFGVSRNCIWHNLQQLRISRKKNEEI